MDTSSLQGKTYFFDTTLDQLAIKYGTDKATQFTRTYGKPHGYTIHLEKFFEPIRHKEIKFLEIGVGGGESIQTWLEYFSNARVFGVEKQRDTNPWDTPGNKAHPRYVSICGDQIDLTFWACFIADYGKDWNVVIDDGGHFSNQIITSYNCLWPYLKSGGLYVIEDLGCSYGAGTVFVPEGWPNHIDWLRGMIDQMNTTDNEIESMTFSKELVILRKR